MKIVFFDTALCWLYCLIFTYLKEKKSTLHMIRTPVSSIALWHPITELLRVNQTPSLSFSLTDYFPSLQTNIIRVCPVLMERYFELWIIMRLHINWTYSAFLWNINAFVHIHHTLILPLLLLWPLSGPLPPHILIYWDYLYYLKRKCLPGIGLKTSSLAVNVLLEILRRKYSRVKTSLFILPS